MKKVLSGILFLIIVLSPVFFANKVNANPLPAYKIKVDLTNQLTYIYRFNGDNAYEFMDVWASSAGAPETPTLQGTYTLKPLTYAGTGEWYYFKSWPCWVNYCTQISGDFCFHTPPMYVDGDYSKTPMSSISEMMYARSHGCVRLLPRQAAFMWHNMGGCKVELIYGTLTEETNRLRDELLMEIPLNSANYPDPVITDKTNYIYTYHNDTPEKLSRLTGLSIEELSALNPSFDFGAPILPGFALKIKSDDLPVEEAIEAVIEPTSPAVLEDGVFNTIPEGVPAEECVNPAPSVSPDETEVEAGLEPSPEPTTIQTSPPDYIDDVIPRIADRIFNAFF